MAAREISRPNAAELQAQKSSENKGSFLQIHRPRLTSSVVDLFERFNNMVDVKGSEEWLFTSGSALTIRRVGDSLARINLSREEDDAENNIEISFFPHKENAPISFTQTRKKEQVSLGYGAVSESGNVILPDLVLVNTEYTHYVDGVTETIIERGQSGYSLSKKTTDWTSGMELSVKEDTEKNLLTVSYDPDVRGFRFPLQLNIYEELEKVKQELERGFGGVA